MIYPIVAYGDPVLRRVARDIEQGEIDLQQLAADMYETMHHAEGVGLAAPQIGMDIRVFVVDGSTTNDEELKTFKQVFINPQVIQQEGKLWPYEEGCLSIPNIREEVKRQESIRLSYFDQDWVAYEVEFSGMKARVIQHEYDHIEGKLFIDYLSPLRRRLLKGKLADITRGQAKTDYRMKFPAKK